MHIHISTKHESIFFSVFSTNSLLISDNILKLTGWTKLLKILPFTFCNVLMNRWAVVNTQQFSGPTPVAALSGGTVFARASETASKVTFKVTQRLK